MKHIVFVCTGNTCRSPLAEALFRNMAAAGGLEIEVRSAGVSASDHMPISAHSSSILREKGIQETLTSSAINTALVEWADLILTMTAPHKRSVIQRYPQIVDKVHTLKEYVEDNPQVLLNIQEVEQIYSEWQLKKALSQEISEEERKRLIKLEQSLPDYDIMDPFGGSLTIYRKSAGEIEQALDKLLKKLKDER